MLLEYNISFYSKFVLSVHDESKPRKALLTFVCLYPIVLFFLLFVLFCFYFILYMSSLPLVYNHKIQFIVSWFIRFFYSELNVPFNLIFLFLYRSHPFRCSSCKVVLSDNEYVLRVQKNVYHQTCFKCVVCYRPLQTGEQFYLSDDNKLVCGDDYRALRTNGKLNNSQFIVDLSCFPTVHSNKL